MYNHLVKRALGIFLSRALSPLDLVFASLLPLVQLETVIIYNLAERLEGGKPHAQVPGCDMREREWERERERERARERERERERVRGRGRDDEKRYSIPAQ